MDGFSGAEKLSEVVRRGWAIGEPADLGALLAGRPSAAGAEVIDAVVEDAEERWDRGLPATLEHYRAAIPRWADEAELIRSLLMLEWARRAGEPAARVLTDLRARHPGLHAQIGLVAELGAMLREGADAGELAPGAALGKFRLVEWLGAGSFGEVWCAWDMALDRYVALKLLPVEGPDASNLLASNLAAVMREARSAAAIDHENVVKVHDAGRLEQTGRCYIDTQLVGDPAPSAEDPKRVAVGRSLTGVVSEDAPGGMGARRAAALLEGACRGAAAAHARGIVHRDIKPSNILVTPSGRPLLGDFGLSLLGAREHRTHPLPPVPPDPGAVERTGGRITGTPAFMAPEQARGEPASPASDIYALGATLRYVLTGRLPFEPTGRHSVNGRLDVIEQVRRSELRPLAEHGAGVPRDLAAISDRAMAGVAGERYVSAEAMAADLAAFLRGRPVAARPAGAARAARMWAARNPGVLALVSVMVVLGGAGLWRYVVNIGRERDRAVGAERVAEQRLVEAQRARATAESANSFLQSVLGAAEPNLLGRHATVLDAVRFAVREIGPRFKDEPLVEADVRSTMGVVYGRFGEDDEARAQLARAIGLFTEHLGAVAPKTLEARKILAMIDWEMHADDATTRAVEDINREMHGALGDDDGQTIAADVDLAAIYASHHQFDRAYAMVLHTSEVQRRRGEGESLEAIQVLQMLASVTAMIGRPEEALQLMENLIEAERRVLGEDHHQRYMTMIEIAPMLERMDRFDEAAARWKSAYEGLSGKLPRGNAYLYVSARSLAAIYAARMGRAEEGLALFAPVFADYLARPEQDWLQLPAGHQVLGLCHLRLGHFAEAEAELVLAERGFAELLGGRTNSAVKKVHGLLVEVYRGLGRPEEARRYEEDGADAGGAPGMAGQPK